MTEKPKNKYAVPLTPYAPGGDLGVSMNAKKTADDFLKEASRKCFSEKDIVIDSIARPYILEAMEAFHQSKRVEETFPPTNEEIKFEACSGGEDAAYTQGFTEGATWMRSKWMKGKKVIITAT